MRRRRFTRRFGRRRGGVKAVTEPKRWSAANFNSFLTQEVVQDPLLGTTVMIELAAHPFHIGDMATGQGQTLTDMVSKFEIGGVVFDIECFVTNVNVSDAVQIFHFTEFLCTIELDTGGNPIVVPDFFQNQKPVAIANVDNIIGNDTDFPTRIHYRSSWTEPFPKTETGGFFNDRNTNRPRFTKNLRLKTYLDSRQGLYLGVCALQNTLTSANFFVRFAGTLYYRLRF